MLVLPTEIPDLELRSVDFAALGDAVQLEGAARALVEEAVAGDYELQTARRAGRRWLRRLEPVALSDARPAELPLKSRGVYLITGGLGGLGLALSRFLAERVSARLLLTARSAPGPEALAAIQELERLGSEVLVMPAAAEDADAMRAAIDSARARFGALDGVIHAAGVPGTGTIALRKQPGEVAAVLAPKLDGLAVLVKLLGSAPLDFVALFSSINSVLGSPGTADYASANAVLDAFVDSEARPPAWRRVVAIDWGPWREVGMAAKLAASGSHREHRRCTARARAVLERGRGSLRAGARFRAQPRRGVVVRARARAGSRSQGAPERCSGRDRRGPAPPSALDRIPGARLSDPAQAGRDLARAAGRRARRRARRLLRARRPLAARDPRAVARRSVVRRPAVVARRVRRADPRALFGAHRRRDRAQRHLEYRRRSRPRGGRVLNAAELLERLRALGADVAVSDGRLRVSSPKGQLTDELKSSIAARKQELIALLSPRDLIALPRTGDLPLSFFQERLWLLHHFQPQSTAYNLTATWTSEGPVDASYMARALSGILQRHEVLRSVFRDADGTPSVELLPEGAAVEIRDLRALDNEDEQRLLIEEDGNEQVHTPFDLKHRPPARFMIYEISGDRLVTRLVAHHIAVDAWSMALIGREVTAAYDGREPPPASPFQYSDFAAWQRTGLESSYLKSELAWWERNLAGAPAVSTLPSLRSRRPFAPGAARVYRLGNELSSALRTLVREERVTPYMALVAACAAVLHSYSGQRDLVIGSPMGSRERPEFESIVGPFVSVLALRMDLNGDPTFTELLARARTAVLDAHAHRDVPFEKLVEHLKPERSVRPHAAVSGGGRAAKRALDRADRQRRRYFRPDLVRARDQRRVRVRARVPEGRLRRGDHRPRGGALRVGAARRRPRQERAALELRALDG